jgi:Tat protein translocase TatB subunit
MNILGIGGLELLLILAVGLFVLGPKRLKEGIREGKRLYRELKRQRQELQVLVEQAIKLEEIKKQLDVDKLSTGAKEIEASLKIDSVIDVEFRGKAEAYEPRESVPRENTGSGPNPRPGIKLETGSRNRPKSDGFTGEVQA